MARSRSLGAQVAELVGSLGAFEPGEYSGEDCAELVKTFTRAEKALATARTRAAARAAECNAHRKEGFADPSEWLARHSGTTARDAKDDLNTINQLEGMPETRDALNAGEVSLGQAGEIARTEAEVPGLGVRAVAPGKAVGPLEGARRSPQEAHERDPTRRPPCATARRPVGEVLDGRP